MKGYATPWLNSFKCAGQAPECCVVERRNPRGRCRRVAPATVLANSHLNKKKVILPETIGEFLLA